MTDSQGEALMTNHCKLMRSIITGRYVIFGDGRPGDQQITNDRTADVNTVTGNLTGSIPYAPDSDDMFDNNPVTFQSDDNQ